MAAFAALLPLIETEAPSVIKAFSDLNKGGGIQQFLKDLVPTLQKAAPAMAAAASAPPVAIYLQTPGTYDVTVNVTPSAK